MQRVLFLAVLSATWCLAVGQEWRGTITCQHVMIGPSGVPGPDKEELDAYVKQLDDRIARATTKLANQPDLIKRMLNSDIGVFKAERERAVLARGGSVVVSNFSFIIDNQRIAVQSDTLPRLVADRAAGTAWIMGADAPDPVTLAPIPEQIDLGKDAVDVPMLGLKTKRIQLKAEDRTFTVLVAPNLPNPYAMALVVEGNEDTTTFWSALATIPGMPMLVESQSNDLTQRWEVKVIDEKVVDEKAFEP